MQNEVLLSVGDGVDLHRSVFITPRHTKKAVYLYKAYSGVQEMHAATMEGDCAVDLPRPRDFTHPALSICASRSEEAIGLVTVHGDLKNGDVRTCLVERPCRKPRDQDLVMPVGRTKPDFSRTICVNNSRNTKSLRMARGCQPGGCSFSCHGNESVPVLSVGPVILRCRRQHVIQCRSDFESYITGRSFFC